MGRILFHEQGFPNLVISGSERAYADLLTRKLFLALFDFDGDVPSSPAWQRQIFSPKLKQAAEHLTNDAAKERVNQMLSFSFGDQGLLEVDGKNIDIFSLTLNTAIAAGSDPIKLLARIHGSCELHGWIDGPDRAWLAAIVEDGLRSLVLRPDHGWEALMERLLARSDRPLVSSFSVCDSFPNRHTAREGGWTPDPSNEDAFYELSSDEQWRLALAGLRAETNRSTRQLRPDHWSAYRFAHKYSVFDLIQRFAK